MKEVIEKMYVQALIDDLPPNVFADQVLRLFGVIKSVCDCSSETFAHHYKGGDKCGYCGGKAES
jgi:hypothetical protein